MPDIYHLQVRTSVGAGGHWQFSAISATGSVMYIANNATGYVKKSVDDGVTWTNTSIPVFNVTGLACSDDGMTVGIITNGQGILLSTNGGTSYANVAPAGSSSWAWDCFDISGDGLTLAAGATGHSIFTSTNGGSTWTDRGYTNYKIDIAINYDGTVIAFIYYGSSSTYGVYISSDGGVTFTKKKTLLYGTFVKVDAVGTRIIVGEEASASGGYPSSKMWLSSDQGATWTAPGTWGTNTGAIVVAVKADMSATGEVIFAWGNTDISTWISQDYGTTWTENTELPAYLGYWASLSLSANKEHAVLTSTGSDSYPWTLIATPSAPPPYVEPTPDPAPTPPPVYLLYKPLLSEEIPLVIMPSNNREGKIMIRQTYPIPVTIVNITIEESLGGG